MTKAEKYLRSYVEAESSEGLLEKLKTMNRETLEDVEEIIEKKRAEINLSSFDISNELRILSELSTELKTLSK